MEDLLRNQKSGWEEVNEDEKKQIVKEAEKIARENGFKSLEEYSELYTGDKVYYINREKNIYLAVIGEEPLEAGINIIGAHADSPRLDLKPNPLCQEGNLAYLKTHYYGGIKKYQWTTIPLALHGVIIKENGENYMYQLVKTKMSQYLQ